MHTRADLDAIRRFCTRHRALLAESETAGCFHCGALFDPSEITEWIDEADGRVADAGVTAACPRCGMDAVLPSAAVPLSPGLLAEMAAHCFGGQFRTMGPQEG